MEINAAGRRLGGSLFLANVDIYDTAAPERAAITHQSGQLSLRHATVSGNRAGRADDVMWLGSTATATYANSIVAGRCTGNSAAVTAQGRNLRTTNLLGTNCPGTTVSIAELALRRATFGGAFEVSGTSDPASVLIDHGFASHCLTRDIRDAARDLRCDTGAFEYGGVVH
jgi:hypothetical protein